MIKLQISAGALVFFAALILLLPLNWLGAAILAAMVHELFHFGAVCLFGGRIRSITICGRGVVMVADPMQPLGQLVSTLAGPIGSLSLLLIARWMPRTAICGFVQGIFNLLPLMPLDGGRILQSLLQQFLSPPLAKRAFSYSQKGFGIIFAACIVLLAVRFGGFLLIPAFFLLPRLLFGGTIDRIKIKRYGYDRIAEENSAQCAETRPLYRRRI